MAIPYITAPITDIHNVLNWLIAQINNAIGGTSGTTLYAGPAAVPFTNFTNGPS
jgi:hypothetical protein